MKKLLLFLSFLLASVFGYAQITFERHYGGVADDAGNSVLQTDDGGYIVAGRTMSYGNGSNDIYVLKTDANGNELWTKTYGGNGWDAPLDMKKTLDNCYVITGGTSSFGAGASDAFMIKIDNNGDSLWLKTYGGSIDDAAYEVDICEDSGYIMSGSTCSFADGFAAAYLIRTNNNGDTLWTKTYEKKDFNGANCMIKTNIDGFILVGVTEIDPPSADGLVIKTNSIGDTLWLNTYGGASYDELYSICEDNNGNYLICGTTYNLVNGSYDIYVIKITVNGELIWDRSFGGTGPDNSYSIIQTNDNNYVIVGSTESFGAEGIDVYLIKINSDGDTIWTRTFGGASDDWASSIQETVDGGYIILGYTHSFGGNKDVYLIKTDENGQVLGMDDCLSPINNRISVFPNPTNGQTNIHISKQFGQTKTLEIFDIIGQLKLTKTDSFSDIDISSLTSGLYFIVLTNTDNERQTMKIIKN